MSQSIRDDVLGELVYDTEWDNYNGVVPFGDKQVTISIGFNSPPELVSKAEVALARTAYLEIVARKAALEAEIVREYLDLYNNTWRDESDPILNQNEFLDAIAPEHIDIELGQVQGVWYNDGHTDLFAGHVILVRFKDDGSIREIVLMG